MKLVIAEKPSLAKAIKSVVGSEYTVTNAFGHIYELAEPDEYLPPSVPVNSKTSKKIWRIEDLPIIPQQWKRIPKKDAKEQIKIIAGLLKQADVVVNAGDPDREGQLLIDEILDELSYRGSVQRVWLKSLTPDAIRDAFAQLKSNTGYKPLASAALARSHADWLVGMNLTRAWTLKNGALLSIGRVQTPTLALIVRRDESIEQFQPHAYFDIYARVQHPNGAFLAKWQPGDDNRMKQDANGRLLDRKDANAIVLKAEGRGTVTQYKSEQKIKPAPLPYSLSALQKAASAKHGFGAQKVLDLAQQLYEEQYTTYPRSDCRYLAEDQFKDLFIVAQRLASVLSVDIADNRHAAFNNSKVTAHTAIIPTNKDASGLTGDLAKLYDMIARSTVALFMPNHVYLSIQTTLSIGKENWTAAGNKTLHAGWTVLFDKEPDEDDPDADVTVLPVMAVNDSVTANGADIKAKKTTPPARFTEGTLIDAMANIHRYIDDVEAKAKLKETAGIGTEATRANVIETLFKRAFIEKKGKTIISTATGRSLINTLPDALTNPVTTAIWETALSDIADGKADLAEFEAGIINFVTTHIQLTANTGVSASKPVKSTNSFKTAPCPVCGKTARRLESKKKKNAFYWACENRDHGLMSDEKGVPGKVFGS